MHRNNDMMTCCVVAGAIALVFGLAACNGDDEQDDVGGGDTAPPADTEPPVDTEPPADTEPPPDAEPTDDVGDRMDAGDGNRFNFRPAGSGQYDQVDRVGMPGLATALAFTDATKNAYNEGTPTDDVNGDFASTLVDNLGTLHEYFRSDIENGLGLTACSDPPPDANSSPDVSPCLSQEVAPGVTVQDAVIPDTLTIDTTADVVPPNTEDVAFPNGRRLGDPVMDIMLAVIFLDLSEEGADTFAAIPLNPPENDANDGDFQTSFPYLNQPF